MQGISRALVRLFVMGLVMTTVLVGAVYAGVGATTAIALGIVLAGVVGLIGIGRRPRPGAPVEQMAAMQATLAAAAATQRTADSTAVEAMAPPLSSREADPEANMPRWRRPSLLEARHSDPTRQAPVYRLPMRFSDDRTNHSDLRIVRYAVVPVLDRPDEVLGFKLTDLEMGDEVLAVGASGAFVEVTCPTGEHGWVHRTTLGMRSPTTQPGHKTQVSQEEHDALTALLSARGLI